MVWAMVAGSAWPFRIWHTNGGRGDWPVVAAHVGGTEVVRSCMVIATVVVPPLAWLAWVGQSLEERYGLGNGGGPCMATPHMATPRIPTVVVATDGNVGVATVACGNIVTTIIGVPPWPWQRGLRHSTVPPR